MSAAFPSRPPVQLDNIIVYTGPPAAGNRKIRPPRPAPTPRERDNPLPLVVMRTGGAWAEHGSRTVTPNRDCSDFTSTGPTSITGEPVSRKELFDIPNRTDTDDYYAVADMAFCTAMWPNLWGDVDNSIDAGNARNEPPDSPCCSTVDVHSACASTMSSAAALAESQQRMWDNGGTCTPAGSSPDPKVQNTTSPADGSLGRDRPAESARAAHDDSPVAVHPPTLEFPDVLPSVCIALEAQPSTLVGRDLQDEHWVHDQDAVTTGDAILVLAGEHSRSASGQETSLIHQSIRAGRACEEGETCDSSDDDIVPWIPKRRRRLPAGSGSAERRDAGQPLMKRQRRQTHIAKPTSASALCRTADSQLPSRPTGRYVPAARSGPRKTIAPTATSTQDEWPVPPRVPELESGPTWEVDRIVGSARRHGKDYYKVLWEPTWEPAENLQGSADTAVAEYRSSNRRRKVRW